MLTDTEVIAIITAVGALLGIVSAAIIARWRTHPQVPQKDPDEGKRGSLLATYSGDQNEFIHLVIEDSKKVHERLDRFESIVEQMKKERTQLIGAFTRYINKLVAAWGSGGTMPYPDTRDFKVLEETLPSNWRDRPTAKP